MLGVGEKRKLLPWVLQRSDFGPRAVKFLRVEIDKIC